MSEPFVAEIKMFAGNFAPRGYAFCNGQIMQITQNTALYSLLGVTYGGNGQTTFALPNLQGRAPLHPGAGPGLTPRTLGQQGGSATVTLVSNQMPTHNHTAQGYNGSASVNVANGNVWATSAGFGAKPIYSNDPPNVSMSPMALGTAGGSQPHNNMQPYLGINFIIALQGLYPSRPD